MHSAKGAALAALVADKGKAKSKDEAKRAEVTTKIQGIFTATEAEVKKLLDGLDPKVEAAFDRARRRRARRSRRTSTAKMSAYKKDRYGGWLGGLRWAKDKLLGMPEKVNEFYAAGRELYLKQMDGVITRVADIVAADLTAAKKRIARGKRRDRRLRQEPAHRPAEGRFRGVEGDRRAVRPAGERRRRQAGVGGRHPRDQVRRGAQGARRADRGAAGREQGPGRQGDRRDQGRHQHHPRARRDASSVLSRVAGVVGDIIKNPIGFLGNLIAGVKGGILKFKDNILDHLRKGLMSWLFGALAEGGVELPDKFDLKGIIKLLASLFGLTWTNIRNRLVKQIGEKAMAAAEKGVEIFRCSPARASAGCGRCCSRSSATSRR